MTYLELLKHYDEVANLCRREGETIEVGEKYCAYLEELSAIAWAGFQIEMATCEISSVHGQRFFE
jgi:hypothetical protein